MKRNIFIIIFLSVFLCACASTNKNKDKPAKYALAINSGSSNERAKIVPVPIAGQMMSLKSKNAPRLVGEAAIDDANKKAVRQPNSGEYINSIMTFDYMAGALYQIYCAPLSITDVQFQPNEHIVAVGAGDTTRWQVSKTFSGVGANRQDHLLIKPVDENLNNGLVVTTDQRTYHLMLHSTQKTYMASVTWRYPDSDGIMENIGDAPTSSSVSDINSIDVSKLDVGYQVKLIQGKQAPDWMPSMVFNDGNKTYIKFPAQMQEAPTLFIGNNIQNDQLVNYRVQGDYYVVDRLFDQAQLRNGLDPKNQIVVQIVRNNH